LIRRLDHAAQQINPFLMVVAIGLAILDASCLIALMDTASPGFRQGAPSPAISAPAPGALPD
jgi:hypothetical protein